jgi:prophage antirepressor-like protein
MTTTLQAFAFDSRAVRVVMKAGEPWFVAKDVCNCLGITNHHDAIRRLDDDEKSGVGITDPHGREQKTRIISESGLYALILRSDGAMRPGTPAHTFRKWVTADVLPALRKTGRYAVADGGDRVEQILQRVDRLCGVIEKLIEALPAILASGRPKVRRPAIFEKDLPVIFALREQGATLPDIVRATGFGQTSLWYVLEGKYAIAPGGRVKRVPGEADQVSAIVRQENPPRSNP